MYTCVQKKKEDTFRVSVYNRERLIFNAAVTLLPINLYRSHHLRSPCIIWKCYMLQAK
jgi:hypothetical protein